MARPQTDNEGGSQTLSRGLTALEIIGASEKPVTVAELSTQLGIHRSMGYRLIKTLEQHGFIERRGNGGFELGIRMTTLARGVGRSLQSAAAPELRDIAETLEMTAFLVTYDGESAVTLISAEPHTADTTVAIKPGSRHSVDRGAPGRVIRSQINPAEYPPAAFEFSHDEVLPGIASIAVPLVLPGSPPAAIAVIFLPQEIDQEQIASRLSNAARQVVAAVSG